MSVTLPDQPSVSKPAPNPDAGYYLAMYVAMAGVGALIILFTVLNFWPVFQGIQVAPAEVAR